MELTIQFLLPLPVVFSFCSIRFFKGLILLSAFRSFFVSVWKCCYFTAGTIETVLLVSGGFIELFDWLIGFY